MITKTKVCRIQTRSEVLDEIRSIKNSKPDFTLIDVGASASPWSKEFLTHIVDIEKSSLPVKQFRGNISMRQVWDEVLEYVNVHGKFDYLVSTHTIEDISSAPMVCDMFGRIAKQGFIAVPSKYAELSRHDGFWRGWCHHRWIFDVSDTHFIGYPKQGFIEYISDFDDWCRKNPMPDRDELQVYWKDDIKLHVVNNDHLGPTNHDVIGYYKALLT